MPKPPSAAVLRDLGNILYELRVRAGLSQEDLAELDCDRTTVSRIETGQMRPSPYMFTNLLGKVGANTVPWGFFLTGISGIDECECILSIYDGLRYCETMGFIGGIRPDMPKTEPRDTSSSGTGKLLALLEKYKTLSEINSLRSDAFWDFLVNCYLNYPKLSPSERIEFAYLIIEKRHRSESVKEIKVNYLLCDDVDRMILNEIALLHMDMEEYGKAKEIEHALLKYLFRLRLVSPKYYRAMVIYNYNISLCELLSKNAVCAKKYAISALNALCHGGEIQLLLYIFGLFIRIFMTLDAGKEYLGYREALKLLCVFFKKYTGFAATADELMHQKRGLSDF